MEPVASSLHSHSVILIVSNDIKHNVYSATGISQLYCNYEYALVNVPKCPIVATYLNYQAKMNADGNGIDLALNLLC